MLPSVLCSFYSSICDFEVYQRAKKIVGVVRNIVFVRSYISEGACLSTLSELPDVLLLI